MPEDNLMWPRLIPGVWWVGLSSVRLLAAAGVRVSVWAGGSLCTWAARWRQRTLPEGLGRVSRVWHLWVWQVDL